MILNRQKNTHEDFQVYWSNRFLNQQKYTYEEFQVYWSNRFEKLCFFVQKFAAS